MLRILVNSVPLVLGSKTKIRYELTTSYIDAEAIKTGIVWHFDIPVSGNEEILNYSNYLQTYQKKIKYDCAIILHAFPIGRGKLIITGIRHDSFRVMVTLNSFAIDFDGINLNDAPYDAEQIGGDPHEQSNVLQHAKDVNAGTIDRDYRFPMVYAPLFYGESGDDGLPEFNRYYLGFLNNWEDGEFLENTVNYVSEYPYFNRNTMVPFPMVFPIFKKLIAGKGYKLRGSLPDQPELQNLIVFNNNTIDKIEKTYTVKASLSYDVHLLPYAENQKTIKFDKEDDEENVYFNGIYSAPEAGNYQLIYNIYAGKEKVYGDVPQKSIVIRIYQDDIIINERTKLLSSNVAVQIYEALSIITTDAAEFRLTAFWDVDSPENAFIMADSQFECHRIANENINIYQNELKLQDHIPEISLHTLINSLRNTFFAALFFDDEEKIVEMELLTEVLANPYNVDLSDYCIFAAHEITPGTEKRFELNWDYKEEPADTADLKVIEGYDLLSQLPEDSTRIYAKLNLCNAIYKYEKREGDTENHWYFYGHNFLDFEKGSGDEAITPAISLCPMPAGEKADKIYPYTSMKGNSPLMKDKTEDTGFQLLIWRGVTDRPIAVPVSHIESGKMGDVSLDFNADDGIVADFGSAWINFITNSETFTQKLTNIDPVKLLEIQDLFLPKRRGNHPRWVYMNGTRALPVKFTAVFDIEGNISECEIELLKGA